MDDYFEFTSFKNIPFVVHGISKRPCGNLKLKKNWDFISIDNNLEKFSKILNFSVKKLILMDQVHGNDVAVVTGNDMGKIMKGVDALVTKEKDVIIGVNFADCVPIFFVDPKSKIIGIAHSGWKGTISEIAKLTVLKMVSLGASINYLKVAIGPSIGKCCYKVPKERYDLFKNKFGDEPKLLYEEKGIYYLDLKEINVKILMELGIKIDNIEKSDICNSCQNDNFFSFRKDSAENYGEMLGIIGIT